MAVTARKREEPRAQQPGIGQFLRDVYDELRKVVWPTRQEATRLTLVVIAVSAGVGLVLGGFDYAIAQVFNLVAH